MFENYLGPIVLVSLVGIIAGLMLSIASKFMGVEVDKTVQNLRDVLPGANCGGCGLAGCDEYAKKLAGDNTTKTNLCAPGGNKVAKALSEILGVEFEDIKDQYAVVFCSGDCDNAVISMEYQGLKTCEASKQFYKGRLQCATGCAGYGDCVKVCQYGAISIVNGIAKIDIQKCIGCGACVLRCPNNIIGLIPAASCVTVNCSSHDKPALKRKNCKSGCIACKKCEKVCPSEAIVVTDFLAKIDPDKCINCGACVDQCPVHVIKKGWGVPTIEEPKEKEKTEVE